MFTLCNICKQKRVGLAQDCACTLYGFTDEQDLRMYGAEDLVDTCIRAGTITQPTVLKACIKSGILSPGMVLVPSHRRNLLVGLGSACIYYVALWLMFSFASEAVIWEALPTLGGGMVLNAIGLGGLFVLFWRVYKP